MSLSLIMNERYEEVKKLLKDCDGVLIGAGAGLSTAAGFIYDGETFLKNFKYMNEKYGYTDMYSAGFHNFESSEEKWAFWSKFIYLNRYEKGKTHTYLTLFDLIKDKEYFILTTNVDHQFQINGFNKDKLFYTQGDYGLFQCSKPCHYKTYDNKEIVLKMLSEIKDNKIPTSLIPHCPVCGEEMSMNLRSDNTFVEDDGWNAANKRYEDFIEKYQNKKILILELGVGYNTPGVIKYPFWRLTYANKMIKYVVVNKGENIVPPEILKQTLIFDEDINDFLKKITD